MECCVPGLCGIAVEERVGDVGADEVRDAGWGGDGETACNVAGSGPEVEYEG